MSLEIDWDQICNDPTFNKRITTSINKFVTDLNLPSYLDDLHIIDFQLGSNPPIFKLKSITDPHEQVDPSPDVNDVQTLWELEYNGDLVLKLQVSLVLNYPGDKFMTLPIKVTMSQLQIHCLCLIAQLTSKCKTVFSVLCDINNDETTSNNGDDDDGLSSTQSRNGVWGWSSAPLQRMAIVQSLNIETEIGDGHDGDGDNDKIQQDRASTLRNVDKLEQFLLAKFKDFLRNEIGWPNMITLDYNNDDEDDGDDSGDTESL